MMDITYTDVLKILIAFFLGGLLGLEREYHNKPAGFRTLIMITIGATVFTILSFRIDPLTPDRIAANIITGIGFIGAGVIFKEGMKVEGLTTSATIWIAASIGMSVGYGAFYLAGGVCLIVLITLILLSRIEKSFDKFNQVRIYKISFVKQNFSVRELEAYFTKLDITFKKIQVMKEKDNLILFYRVNSSQMRFELLDEYLVQTEEISGFEV
jgi:putative Mg2+ transporter-C (MgtC) family protein